jgi:DNA-binding Lrp family transcriptional regulator
MKTNKGFVNVAILIAAVILAAGIGYLMGQNKPEAKDSEKENIPEDVYQEQTTGNYEGWETYSDSALGLSFKYPAYMGAPNQQVLSTRIEATMGTPTQTLIVNRGLYYSQPEGRNLTLEEVSSPLPYQKSIRTKVDGRNAVILSGAATETFEQTAYIQGRGENIVTVDYSVNYENDTVLAEDVFKKVLASIKLNEPVVSFPKVQEQYYRTGNSQLRREFILVSRKQAYRAKRKSLRKLSTDRIIAFTGAVRAQPAHPMPIIDM